ncbi:MAG: hypothetical protein EA411_12505 [Saprospirales bacterium]|nr:MAG: hypothetical protein EA411_12505 [Saprospirales bacterium]
MNALVRTLMYFDKLSCRQATLLAARRSEQGLSRVEKLQLWYHYQLCHVCKIWENQSAALDKLLTSALSSMKEERSLSDDQKREIKKALKKQQ